MKKLLLIILLIFKSALIFGQQDSSLNLLLNQLKIEQTKTSRLNLLMKIVDLLGAVRSIKQLEYLDQAEKLAIELNNNNALIEIFKSKGVYYSFRGDFNKSLDFFLKSVRLIENSGNTPKLVVAYLGIGQTFLHLGNNLNKSKEYYDKARVLAHRFNDTRNLNFVYEQIAMYHYLKNDFDSSLIYHKKALFFAKKYNSFHEIGDIYSEIGLTHIQKNEIDLALKYFANAISSYQNLSNLPLPEMSYVYSDMGLAYSKKKDWRRAFKSYQTAIDFAKKAHSPETEMESYGYLAELFEQNKDYENQADFLKKYYSIKDSLFNSDSKSRITELETEFRIEKKNAEIARNELDISESNYQRKVWGGIAFFLLILTSILVYFYRKNQKKSLQISYQKEELEKLNHVKDRLFAVLSHDLRNPLMTLKTYFLMLNTPNLSEEKKAKYTEITQKTVDLTSNLMDNLLFWADLQIKNQDVNLTTLNLKEIIDNVIDLVNPQSVHKNIEIIQEVSLSTIISNQIILETILRNLLTNAIKFSYENSKIIVSAHQKNEYSYLTVRDFGVGMNPEKIQSILKNENTKSTGTLGEKGNGIGLLLVRELVKKINAKLIIESQEKVETSFIIQFCH